MADLTFGDVLEQRIVKEAMRRYSPEGFPMTIRNQKEWAFIAEAVNMGIDAYLEAFTRSTFDNGSVYIHPDEMHILLRRLGEILDLKDRHDGENGCAKDASKCSGGGYCTQGTLESFYRCLISVVFTRPGER